MLGINHAWDSCNEQFSQIAKTNVSLSDLEDVYALKDYDVWY